MTSLSSPLYERLKSISVDNPLCTYTEERCARLEPLIEEIIQLKNKKNAIILAHTYVHPDIIYGVADFVGDSYFLAKQALRTDAETIVFPAVRFMAETAKILNPGKTVLDPNPNGGCSLADSITAEQVAALRKRYPDHTFVCYINTTAAVKAACDVCVTSSNVYQILEKISSDKIYFLPDRLMGENARRYLQKKGIEKDLLVHPGSCYVHEEFDPAVIDQIRSQHRDALVFAHPECRPEVVAKADFVGSTSEMHKEALRSDRPLLLLTECGVASRLNQEAPHLRIVGGCVLCKYMRSNSLHSIAQVLKDPLPNQVVTIDRSIQTQASHCIERMFAYVET